MVTRQVMPPDETLVLRPPPVVAPPVPVAVPTARTRRAAAPPPEPPPEPPAPPAPIPEVASVAPVVTLREEAPSEPAASLGAADAIWASPVPTFTFLAGAAGSGKTFLTKAWAEREPGLVLCATTGIAAINLGGETINSILGYFDTASLQELYLTGALTAKLGRLWKSGVRRLVLDEVSMLSGDQFGFLVRAVEEVNTRDYILKTKTDEEDGEPPNLGLTLVGDFCQLPPVKAPFAFEAPEWDRIRAEGIVTLTQIRRQADAEFIAMLRAARLGRGKVVADYFLARQQIQQETDDHFEGPTILAKNESVDRYNALRLQRVEGAPVSFTSARWGKQRSEWGNPEKPPATWGIPEQLDLKEGALVMILANRRTILDPEFPNEKRLIYVNGDLGELVGAGDEIAYYKPGGEAVRKRVAYVRLQRTGEIVSVFPVERLVRLPCDSARRTELRKLGLEDRIDEKWEIVGGITYMPLRVAYATTVHKSQGLSLDRVQVNLRDPFFKSAGMLYVALSRARTAEGLRLVGSAAAIVERCTTDRRLGAWL